MAYAGLPWQVVPLTDTHCVEVCTWKYPSPYELYNWPSWDIMLREQTEFADGDIRAEQYRAIVDEKESLCGFVQFFPMLGVTRLGLGLRPDLCGKGKGIGEQFVRLITREALRRAPGQEIDLEVLVWNERAIRTYERAGFSITDTYEKRTPTGMALFHCMVYDDYSKS
ncbi:GNAT family N-acetyltransferase [Paenibacillus planticolens]|uniref:GNAT family N-acetyltransferase n=1 Tax=Paenibacillus planticolens TaxID=2654976 RepID=A0ABX1ZS14_9BACL|nr:GNAT family N-acetyltransferase [Paenibacillus planticolens]NOV02513.1 GNAT family N-acetyltransferase [Paenibacillus planticolens]